MPNLMNPRPLTCGILAALSLSGGHLSAQSASSPDGAAELARKLNNPVAALISVPIQANFLFNAGPGDGFRETTNIQPVSQVLKIGGLPVSIGLMGNWYAETPASTPDWGVRFVFTFLFPKS